MPQWTDTDEVIVRVRPIQPEDRMESINKHEAYAAPFSKCMKYHRFPVRLMEISWAVADPKMRQATRRPVRITCYMYGPCRAKTIEHIIGSNC